MVKDIMSSVRDKITTKIKEHATLVEVSQIDRTFNKTDTELVNLKELVNENSGYIAKLTSTSEHIDKRLKEWEKIFPKMQDEVINVKSDIAARTTKEEFNVVMQQLPQVATKQDTE